MVADPMYGLTFRSEVHLGTEGAVSRSTLQVGDEVRGRVSVPISFGERYAPIEVSAGVRFAIRGDAVVPGKTVLDTSAGPYMVATDSQMRESIGEEQDAYEGAPGWLRNPSEAQSETEGGGDEQGESSGIAMKRPYASWEQVPRPISVTAATVSFVVAQDDASTVAEAPSEQLEQQGGEQQGGEEEEFDEA